MTHEEETAPALRWQVANKGRAGVQHHYLSDETEARSLFMDMVARQHAHNPHAPKAIELSVLLIDGCGRVHDEQPLERWPAQGDALIAEVAGG